MEVLSLRQVVLLEHKPHQQEVFLVSNLKLIQHHLLEQVAYLDNQLGIQAYLVIHSQLQMDHLTKLRETLN